MVRPFPYLLLPHYWASRNRARRSQRGDYVRNGAVGTVVAVTRARSRTRDTIRVRFDGIGEITLPRSFFDERERRDGRTVAGPDVALGSRATHGYLAVQFLCRVITRHRSARWHGRVLRPKPPASDYP